MTDSEILHGPDERIGSSPEFDSRNEQGLDEHAVPAATNNTLGDEINVGHHFN
jgi:hypothetical protein